MWNRLEKENNPINKLTIVEGYPNRKNLPLFSSNLENLLLKAATDKNFKENLLQDRNSILEDSEFSLSPQDKMILKSISVTRLSDMIEKFTIQQTSRRSFLKNAAAALALLTIGCIPKAVNTSSGIDDNTPPLVTPKPLPTNYCSNHLE